jgi:hypothetical protein
MEGHGVKSIIDGIWFSFKKYLLRSQRGFYGFLFMVYGLWFLCDYYLGRL